MFLAQEWSSPLCNNHKFNQLTLSKQINFPSSTVAIIYKYQPTKKPIHSSSSYIFFFLLCRVLTRTTQPAHLVALLIATIVVSILWPNLVQNASTTGNEPPATSSGKYTTLLYLGIFATHFGTQMWMTFVSGKTNKVVKKFFFWL